MKVIIYDMDQKYEAAIRKKYVEEEEEVVFVSDDGSIQNCTGCFDCFVKTPGQCVLSDRYNNMGGLLGSAQELIILSQCIYGTYSPFVRNVLDRCLSYIHPDFTKRNTEIHHKLRYKNTLQIEVHFYGKCSEQEKETAKKTVAANAVNFGGESKKIDFVECMEELIDENCID